MTDKSQVVAGKILDFLEGKPPGIFRQWLIYLKNWLERRRTLRDFFVYFNETLKNLAREKQKLEETRKFIEKQRQGVRAEYEENPPPKSSDFDRFSDYPKAMEEWEG